MIGKFSGADMIDHPHESPTLDDLITSNPQVLGGRRVFRGTRVPVEVLFENLADGMSIDEILDQYETLDRDDVARVLELTSQTLAGSRAARERLSISPYRGSGASNVPHRHDRACPGHPRRAVIDSP